MQISLCDFLSSEYLRTPVLRWNPRVDLRTTVLKPSGNGLTLGDQNAPILQVGKSKLRSSASIRNQRYLGLASPAKAFQRALLGGWGVSGIATIQSGKAMTIADTNPNNVFGISEDKAGLSGTCTKSQFVTKGPITNKVDHYFNASCFISPPVSGADGIRLWQ